MQRGVTSDLLLNSTVEYKANREKIPPNTTKIPPGASHHQCNVRIDVHLSGPAALFWSCLLSSVFFRRYIKITKYNIKEKGQTNKKTFLVHMQIVKMSFLKLCLHVDERPNLIEKLVVKILPKYLCTRP